MTSQGRGSRWQVRWKGNSCEYAGGRGYSCSHRGQYMVRSAAPPDMEHTPSPQLGVTTNRKCDETNLCGLARSAFKRLHLQRDPKLSIRQIHQVTGCRGPQC